VTRIADTSFALPGFPGGGNFQEFGATAISNQAVVFTGERFISSSLAVSGIYTGTGGALTTVVNTHELRGLPVDLGDDNSLHGEQRQRQRELRGARRCAHPDHRHGRCPCRADGRRPR
jgi:hypothetical protein